MIQEITERLNVKIYHETGKLKVFKKKDFEERTNYTTQKITHVSRVNMMISADIVG